MDDDRIALTEWAAKTAAKARKKGDEALASGTERYWRDSLPAYGTQERRWHETLFANVYREISQ